MRYKQTEKKDLPFLVDCILKSSLPHIKSNIEKINTIAKINDYTLNNYQEFTIIYYFLRPIGIYHLIDKQLKLIYLLKEFQNYKIGNKIIKQIKNDIDTIKLTKENNFLLKICEDNGFIKSRLMDNEVILRKEILNENK